MYYHITAECIATAFCVAWVVHPKARRLPENHYPAAYQRGVAAHGGMPEGAELLLYPISRAPGFRIGNVYVMAGVPQVMQATFTELKYRLRGGEDAQPCRQLRPGRGHHRRRSRRSAGALPRSLVADRIPATISAPRWSCAAPTPPASPLLPNSPL